MTPNQYVGLNLHIQLRLRECLLVDGLTNSLVDVLSRFERREEAIYEGCCGCVHGHGERLTAEGEGCGVQGRRGACRRDEDL